jgi:hypothetical protein
MCLRQDTQKLISYLSSPKWPEKGGALSLLIHNLASEYVINKVQVNQDGMELNGLHLYLVYADDVTLLGEGINIRVNEHEKGIMAFCTLFFTYINTHFNSLHLVSRRYSDSLRAGGCGDRISVRARFSAHVQTGPGAQPPPRQWVPALLPGGKAAGAWR